MTIEKGYYEICFSLMIALLVLSSCDLALVKKEQRLVPVYGEVLVTDTTGYFEYRDTIAVEVTRSNPVLSLNDYNRIAIYPLECEGGYNRTDSRYYTDLMENWFVQNTEYDIVTRTRLEELLIEQDLGQSGRLNQATIARIRQILGVDAIVAGTLYRSNESQSWTLQVIDSETAEILWGNSGRSSFRNAFPSCISGIIGTEEYKYTVHIENRPITRTRLGRGQVGEEYVTDTNGAGAVIVAILAVILIGALTAP